VIVDTHCHLNFNSFDVDLDDVLSRARSVGVERIVVPAIDLQTCEEVIYLSVDIPEVYAAIGIHPNDCAGFTLRDIDRLHELAKQPKIVAIGEIGLDKYHDDVDLEQQIYAFEAQLDLANALDLPVLVHNREADDEITQVINKWISSCSSQKDRGIMHAFSSSIDFAMHVTNLGFSLGVAGPITYKNAGEKRNIFSTIDRAKIVLETDAPFLSPVPFRGKRNEPAYTTYIADELANLWDITPDQVYEITTNNAARIFQWINLK
jgi:TatD DNase family protein